MARHMRNGRDYSRPGPKVDYELRKDSNNAARSGDVYDKIKEIQSQIVPTASSKLLLDTTAVTTSEKIFTLEDDYTNYKELYFEIEMNFTPSSNIYFFTNIIRADTIRTDYGYVLTRNMGTNSEGTVTIRFISDNNTDVKLKKISNVYNGCRRLRIFGIKC